MCDIEVAADDHALLFRQRSDVSAEVVFPFHPVIQAFKAVLRVRDIDADKMEIFKFHGNHPAFMVMFVNAHVQGYGQWFHTCINRRARVAFLVGIVPI